MGRGRGSWIYSFFCLVVAFFRMLTFFVPFLCPWRWAQHQCTPTTQVWLMPLPLWCAQWGLQPDLSLIPQLLGPQLLGPQRAPNYIYGSHLCPSSVSPNARHPCSFLYACLQKYQCSDPSDMFVCWTGNPFFNYSCLTCCNFKGRDLEVLSLAMLLTSSVLL